MININPQGILSENISGGNFDYEEENKQALAWIVRRNDVFVGDYISREGEHSKRVIDPSDESITFGVTVSVPPITAYFTS